MNLVLRSLFRGRRFVIAVLSVTLGSVLVLPMVSSAWTPTTPQISVAIFGGTGNDYGYSVAVDAFGNVYTTGSFNDTADFDPSASNSLLTSAGGTDVFVSKLNAGGEFQWAKKFGGGGQDQGNSVAVDSSGNVYTTGSFNDTADFDPHDTNTQNLASVGGTDVFVSKLNSAGEFLWAKKLGGGGQDQGNSVAVDSSGNVYTTGRFEGAAAFNPSSSANNLASAGGADVFVSKLDSFGGFVWAKKFGGTGDDPGYSVAVDSTGNVYTTGAFNDTADFDPHDTNTQNLASAGGYDVFVSKLDSFGGFVWAKKFGGADYDIGNSVAVDSSGIVYTTGLFEGTADFDPHDTNSQNLASAGGRDVFVSKLDSFGGFVWAKKFGGTGSDSGNSVAVDSSGTVYTTGAFNDTADFDPHDTNSQNLASAGGPDVFVSKLNAAGGYVWAKKLGGAGEDRGLSVAVDSSGNVYTAGYFQGSAAFDPSSSTNNVTSAGNYDAFVSKLDELGNSQVTTTTTTTTTVPSTTTTVPVTTTTTTVPSTTTTVPVTTTTTTVPSTTTTVPVTTTTTTVPTVTTTVPVTTTTVLVTAATVPTTTTTTTVPVTKTTTTVPTATTTVPVTKALVLTTKKTVTAKAVATYAKLIIKTKFVVSLKVAKASCPICRASGSTLRGLKSGLCKVTVTVKPAKGNSVSKTVVLKILK